MREMKDSGINWIGEIPIDWKVAPLKFLLKKNDGGIWGQDENINSPSSIVLRSTEQTIDGSWDIQFPAVRDLSEYSNLSSYQLKKNDLLITKSSGSSKHIGKTTIVDEKQEGYYYSNFLQRLRVNNSIDPMYLWYLLNSPLCREQFVYMQNSTSGLGNISADNINNLLIPLPCISKQKLIINFLNKKCKEINFLLQDIEEQINNLKEEKKSFIRETIIKGLNNIDFKVTGITYLDIIPKDWEIKKGKFILDLLQRPIKESDIVITCFRDGEVTLRSNRREEGFTFSDKEIGYQGIEPEDLVVHGMDGFAGAIGISDSRGKASPVLNVLDSTENKKYIMYYLRSLAYSNVFLALATGIRVRSCDLRWNKLGNIYYPVPPIEEQNQIVSTIDYRLEEIDQIISLKEHQLKTLKEYRKSIIFEYVTGKKVVPENFNLEVING